MLELEDGITTAKGRLMAGRSPLPVFPPAIKRPHPLSGRAIVPMSGRPRCECAGDHGECRHGALGDVPTSGTVVFFVIR